MSCLTYCMRKIISDSDNYLIRYISNNHVDAQNI